jgi:hypothetical protein
VLGTWRENDDIILEFLTTKKVLVSIQKHNLLRKETLKHSEER